MYGGSSAGKEIGNGNEAMSHLVGSHHDQARLNYIDLGLGLSLIDL